MNFDLEKLEARARRCAEVVGECSWYDDDAAKDLLAPLYSGRGGMTRDIDDVVDALFLAACDPRAIVHLLETVKTLMDDDSMLAAQQRASKAAIDSMVAARKERDEANISLASLREVIEGNARTHSLQHDEIDRLRSELAAEREVSDARQKEVASMRAVVEAAHEISAQIETHGRYYFHSRQKLSDALAAHAEVKP